MSYREFVLNGDFISSKCKLESSNNRWKQYWFDCCVEISEIYTEFKEQYSFDEEHLVIVKIEKNIITSKKIGNPHNYELNVQNNYFYLIKFYDENDNFLRSKVGTTTRTLNKRFNELLGKNTPYTRMGATKIIVDKIYSTIDNPEGIENYLKGILMLDYTKTGNDQFIEDIDWEDYDKIIQDYLQKKLLTNK